MRVRGSSDYFALQHLRCTPLSCGLLLPPDLTRDDPRFRAGQRPLDPLVPDAHFDAVNCPRLRLLRYGGCPRVRLAAGLPIH